MTTPTGLTPFTLHVADAALDDLRRRLDATRWPDERPGAGWEDGVPLEYARSLASYWSDSFDWREQERRLNELPQFTTPIDGHDVHLFHVASSRPDAQPLLLVHGWPSGPSEFLEMVPMLTEPDGGGPAFEVVVPTIPGFGVSGPVSGWTLTRVADAFAELMTRLGHERFLVHGFDTGAGVARELGLRHPDRVIGVHTTGLLGGEGLTEETADLSDPDEARAVADGQRYQYDLGGYAMLQSTRPQAIAYALADSPVAQMTWMVEQFRDWTVAEGDPDEALGRDAMLTLVSIFWFFGVGGSSARYYKDGLPDWGVPLAPSTTPTAILVMPNDIGRPVRRVVEQTDNVVHWTTAPRGGHFAAWEQPAIVADDIRASARAFAAAQERRNRAG